MRKRRQAVKGHTGINGLIGTVIAQVRPGGRVDGADLARALLLAVAENDFYESRISPEVILLARVAAAWIRRDVERERAAADGAKEAAELRIGPLDKKLQQLALKYWAEGSSRNQTDVAKRLVRRDLDREVDHLKRLGLLDENFQPPNANTIRRKIKKPK
jgi:hypothetical protein